MTYKNILFITLFLFMLIITSCENKPDENNSKKEYLTSIFLDTCKSDMLLWGDSNALLGGHIRFPIKSFPQSFRPFGRHSDSYLNSTLNAIVYETLLARHPYEEGHTSSIATHWHISDDKKTFYFYLDSNTRFSNGDKLTAKDIIATWKLITNNAIDDSAVNSIFSEFFLPTAKSDYVLVVKSKNANWANFHNLVDMPILCFNEINDLTGQEFLDKFKYQMPIGSGEYVLDYENIEPNKLLVLKRRTDYWAKDYDQRKYLGNFDKIYFKVIYDKYLQYQLLLANEIDFFEFNSSTLDLWKLRNNQTSFKKGLLRSLTYNNNSAHTVFGIAFNMRRKPFNDKRIRQAFAHLYNRDILLEKMMHNEYKSINSQFPNTAYENPNNKILEYDKNKAIHLLNEAGWTSKNSNGLLVKDGKEFIVEMAIPKSVDKYLLHFKESLESVGIKLSLMYLDWNLILEKHLERDFDITWFSSGQQGIPAPKFILYSELADQKYNYNIEGFKNKRVDILCDKLDTCFDPKIRLNMLQSIDSLATESCKNILGWQAKNIKYAYSSKYKMPHYILPHNMQTYETLQNIALFWWSDSLKNNNTH